MIRILKVYLKGKHGLFNKISHKRFFELLGRANGLDDQCYTIEEIQYLNSKLF
jgi:hypothetical protein